MQCWQVHARQRQHGMPQLHRRLCVAQALEMGASCHLLLTHHPSLLRCADLCVKGSSAPQPCPGGTHADQSVLATVGHLSNLTSDCIICPAGTACSVGSAQPMQCLPGSVAPSANMETCDLCGNGKFQRQYGQTSCEICIPGFYCKVGAAEPVPCRIHAGTPTPD